MDKTCILIVDDNPEIREIINVLLGGEGFEVSEAENGTQALTLIEQQDFDLIILDIMMPGPNGYQTCRKIRELSNAPILFLSARTKESDKTLGFSSGGDDYLAKPFSYNELISRSKALIRRYQVYKGKNESGNQSINSASVNPTADPIASTSNASDSRHRILLFHDLEINQTVREVHKNGKLLDLTETEYSMLDCWSQTAIRHFLPSVFLSLSGRSLITTVQIILSPYIFETYAPKWKIIPVILN